MPGAGRNGSPRLSGVSDERDDEAAIAGIRHAVARAGEQLSAAGTPDEAVATFVPARRVLVFTKVAALVPAGRAWRLGVFLLDRPGTLYQAGTTTRAVEPGRASHHSVSAEQRREYRAAAFNGPFARGETVNFTAVPIKLDADSLHAASGPLFISGGRALVRWNPSADDTTAMEFGTYLAERVDLAISPPEGA